MTQIELKVNTLLKNINKQDLDDLSEDNILVHPHQQYVINNSDFKFRKIPIKLINYYNNYIHFSEIGMILNKYPYLLKVYDYIKYRTLTFRREGFIFSKNELLNGTNFIRPFDGDRHTFYKYLKILEDLNIIFIDKRLYKKYIWINFNVIGQYLLQGNFKSKIENKDLDDEDISVTNTLLSDITELYKGYTRENIESVKKSYRVYNFDLLDDKSKLELLWSYMLGYKQMYDMFDNASLSKYVEAIENNEHLKLNKSLLYRKENTISDNCFDLYRLPNYTFKHGGLIMTDGQFKLFNINDLVVNTDGTIKNNNNNFEEIKKTKEVKKSPKLVNLKVKKEKTIDKQPYKDILWDEVDLANLPLAEFDKKLTHKRSLINYLDKLFTDGVNNSTRVKELGITYSKTISLELPKLTKDRNYYYAVINGLYHNLYKRMLKYNFDDTKIRSFMRWIGINYFKIFKSIKWLSVDSDSLEPTLKFFVNSEKSKIADEFFNFYTRHLINLKNKENSKKPLTIKTNTDIINHEKLTVIKSEIEAKIKAKYEESDEANKNARLLLVNKIKKLSAALDNAGINPLDVI